jgi:hypothetical protein
MQSDRIRDSPSDLLKSVSVNTFIIFDRMTLFSGKCDSVLQMMLNQVSDKAIPIAEKERDLSVLD